MLNKYGLDLDPKLDPELKKNLSWIQIRNKSFRIHSTG